MVGDEAGHDTVTGERIESDDGPAGVPASTYVALRAVSAERRFWDVVFMYYTAQGQLPDTAANNADEAVRRRRKMAG